MNIKYIKKKVKPVPTKGFTKLIDLPIARWIDSETIIIGSIKDSPYYKALQAGSDEEFKKYHTVMQNLSSFDAEINWDDFIKLKNDIACRGFKDANAINGYPPIYITDQHGQEDGHHRLAIIAHLYGLNTSVYIDHGFVSLMMDKPSHAVFMVYARHLYGLTLWHAVKHLKIVFNLIFRLFRKFKTKKATPKHAPRAPSKSEPLKTPLVILDIGCRWGFAERFVQPDAIDNFKVYGFDPDPDECARLQDLYSKLPPESVTCVPLALAGQKGTRTLYITKEPACSSLHRPIQSLVDHYPSLDCMRLEKTIEIEVVTLKEWAEKNAVNHVDYIKLDTQGSELEILKGAGALLSTIKCIDIEVEFNPLYEGQSVFSEVDGFLRLNGFELWRLSNLVHYGYLADLTELNNPNTIHYDNAVRLETKAYGGQLFWADARYVHQSTFSPHKDEDTTKREALLFNTLGMQDITIQFNKIQAHS
jgi:FkbM family methyltransferase